MTELLNSPAINFEADREHIFSEADLYAVKVAENAMTARLTAQLRNQQEVFLNLPSDICNE